MRMQEIITRELSRLSGPLITLETGSIRSTQPEYESGDGWSTLAFARYAKGNGGSFTSIDMDTCAAEEVLKEHSLREVVDLREGNSLDVLPDVVKEKGAFDVVLLDSDNDPNLIMDEFFLVRPALCSGSVLLVDDVDLTSPSVRKGHKILPFLQQQGYAPDIITRYGNSFTTGVMKVIM